MADVRGAAAREAPDGRFSVDFSDSCSKDAMRLSPDEERSVRQAFDEPVNLGPAELRAWTRRPQSRQVGQLRRGETETIGRQSARRTPATGGPRPSRT